MEKGTWKERWRIYIEDWISQFGEALDQPDLLTAYLRLLAKARRK
jgi:hypothetical protein